MNPYYFFTNLIVIITFQIYGSETLKAAHGRNPSEIFSFKGYVFAL